MKVKTKNNAAKKRILPSHTLADSFDVRKQRLEAVIMKALQEEQLAFQLQLVYGRSKIEPVLVYVDLIAQNAQEVQRPKQ